MAEVDIGELLSTKRTEKGMSVAVAASNTRLSADNIQHLEANEFTAVGTSVYVRGYLGLYANFLGLDAANLIQLYNTQHPATEVETRPSVKAMTTRKKIKRHSKTISVLLALIAFAALTYAYSRIEPLVLSLKTPQISNVSSDMQEVSKPLSSIDTTIQAAQSAKHLAEDVLNGLPVAGNELSASQSKQSEEDFLNGEQSTSEAQATGGLLALTLESTSDLDIETSESLQQASKEGQMSLDLQFNNECWLKVADKQGKVLASGMYNKRKHLSVIGKGPFVITTWRPEAVAATVLNGKSVDLNKYKIGKKTFQLK